MTILKQITKTSLLIPYGQLYIQSHYHHKQLIPEQNTGENTQCNNRSSNPILRHHLQFTPINTPALPLPRPYYPVHTSTVQTAYMDGMYNILIALRFMILHFLKYFYCNILEFYIVIFQNMLPQIILYFVDILRT